MSNEIVLYQSNKLAERIEVRIENETIWLSLNQIAQLFGRDKSVISRHFKNIYNDKELIQESTVAKYATVQIEAGRKVKREIEYYNLDAIISVGYRVNSKQGTQFRIWATKVLKDHLLKGYSVNQRINKLENKFDKLNEKVEQIDLEIHTSLPPKQGIFFDGQVFDAYVFVADIIKQAKQSIIVIDNFIDESVLTMLTKRNKNVDTSIYTKINKQLLLDVKKYNLQYPKIKIKALTKSHDRFMIIDKKEVYHFGASLKDLGKKWFAFSKMEMNAENILKQLASNTKTLNYE